MLKINPIQIQGIKNENTQQKTEMKPAFKGGTVNAPVTSMPEVTKDYSVKVPMAYAKIGELNLPYGTKAHMYKMANGQRVVIIPKDGVKTYVETYVNTGSMNEFDNIRFGKENKNSCFNDSNSAFCF